MIYFDNAATTFPKPPAVMEAAEMAIRRYGGNPGRGGHDFTVAVSEKIYEVRLEAAELFGAKPENVIFTTNCTHALNIAIKGLVKRGSEVVISNLEHNSVTRPLHKLTKLRGVRSRKANVFEKTDKAIIEDYKRKISPRTSCVISTHASNVTGQILPIRDIYALCKRRNIPFVVDAAQTAGIIPINVGVDCDVICIAAHKGLYGPTSCGMMILGDKIRPATLIEGGSGGDSLNSHPPNNPPERYEAGTVNSVGILALGEGIRFVKDLGCQTILNHELELCQFALEELSDIYGVTIYQNSFYSNNRAPILLFNFDNLTSGEGAEALNNAGFALRGGLHCAPSAHKVLGTLPTGAIRFSPSAFNRHQEVEKFCAAVRKISLK